jgi:hypothetical protein
MVGLANPTVARRSDFAAFLSDLSAMAWSRRCQAILAASTTAARAGRCSALACRCLLFRDIRSGLGSATRSPRRSFAIGRAGARAETTFFGDPAVPETSRFADVKTPILSLGMTDDTWGTPRAIEGTVDATTPTRRLKSAFSARKTPAARSAISAISARALPHAVARPDRLAARRKPLPAGTAWLINRRALPSSGGSSADTWSQIPRPQSGAPPSLRQRRLWSDYP